MEERSTRFSLLVTGIFVVLLLVLGILLRPRNSEEPERKPLAVENRQPAPKVEAESHLLPPPVPPQPIPASGVPIPPQGGVGLGNVPRAVAHNQQILTHCRLVDDPNNDADSFRVRTSNGEYRFSLYFVDAPDANGSIPEITTGQCRYFGGLSEQELRTVARDAQRYVVDLLHDRQFDVVTRWESAVEEAIGEIHTCRAFVYLQAAGNAAPVNLAELLVENGLATLSRCSEMLPDMTPAQRFQRGLQSLEYTAMKEQRGAWRFSEKLQPTSGRGR